MELLEQERILPARYQVGKNIIHGKNSLERKFMQKYMIWIFRYMNHSTSYLKVNY